jgi:hypothetical protein
MSASPAFQTALGLAVKGRREELKLDPRAARQRLNTRDAINSLQHIGLIHRCGELIFPTRAALRAKELEI